MKQESFRFFILASILIHVLILLAIRADLLDSDRPRTIQVNLEIVEGPIAERVVVGGAAATLRKRVVRKAPSVKKLLPSWQDRLLERQDVLSERVKESANLGEVREAFTDPYSYGETSSATIRIDRGTFEELFRRVDSHLIFESILGEYNHFGNCYFYFAIRADGSLSSETLRAKCADRILKVRAARILRKALQESLPPSLQFRTSGKQWIATRFIFTKNSPCSALSGSSGNFLTFCRNSSTRPVASSRFGDFLNSGEVSSIDPSANKKKIRDIEGPALPHSDLQVGFRGNYEALLDYDKRRYRKETQFNPFLSEEKDPDWEL